MLVECPHCDGTGQCNDEFHQDTYAGAAKELFGSEEEQCPSCNEGGRYTPGPCPHCGGAGSIDDSLL